MRRKLTISMFLVIAILAMTATAYAAPALSLGGGISLTESEKGVSMGSRIDACRKEVGKCSEGFKFHPIASWFSSTGMMPFLVMTKSNYRDAVGPNSLVYRAAVDFNNVERIENVELTPDHGITVWEATCTPLKGYQVEIPYLNPGGYGFEWKVASRDKHNRLMIIFIPISWSSNRTNSVVQQTMVQSAPESAWNFNDEQWISLISPAFQPATALPDPGYLAKRAAQRQVLDQMNQSAPIVDQPKPVCAELPKPAPVVETPRPVCAEPKPERKVERPRTRVDVKSDGYAIIAPRPKVYNLFGDYTICLTGMDHGSYRKGLCGQFAQGSAVIFTRNGYEVASGTLTEVRSRTIVVKVDYVRGTGIRSNDKFTFDTYEGQGGNR